MNDLFLNLKDQPRILMEADLRPAQGTRFQPTGFPDLGPGRFQTADGRQMLLVESAQSVANRLEKVCWDESKNDLIEQLTGLPYVQIDLGQLGSTNTLLEFHRLNSPYIWKNIDASAKQFQSNFKNRIGIIEKQEQTNKKEKTDEKKKKPDKKEKDVSGVLDMRKLAKAAFYYDPNSVIHGLFLEKVAGRLRLTRLLSGFIEAEGVQAAESGGVKFDRVSPSAEELNHTAEDGFGNVPFHRTEFTAERITAFFNVDLGLLRGYGFDKEAEDLLLALSFLKIRRFISLDLRLRSACDLEVIGDITITRPGNFTMPKTEGLIDVVKEKIQLCRGKNLFANPAITRIGWSPDNDKSEKKEDKTS